MRLLLAIGCDAYEAAEPLSGAEHDARRVFEALTREAVGDYDPVRSRLLLSPTSDAVRAALREVLYSHGPIDTFTFFFAGHGGVRAGSFYMWLRDTAGEAQSVSALALSDLLRNLNEVGPAQSNIIIDACESGGLIADLGVMLKSDVMGNAGTPGVTLVATSAQDQYANETAEGGFGANALLDCLEGRDFIQDHSETLDLTEIGRRMSVRLAPLGQDPVVWGLNLFGAPRFCRNPYYGSDPSRPLREITQAWPTPVREHYDLLWKAYASVSAAWRPRDFAGAAEQVIAPLAADPPALAAFIDRFGQTVRERAETSNDAFRGSEVLATLLVCLLPYLDEATIAQAAQRLLDRTIEAGLAAVDHLVTELDGEPYALLAKHGGGMADLFYLPLRLAKVLGWTATLVLSLDPEDPRRAPASAHFEALLRTAITTYGGSVQAMSDAQASAWLQTGAAGIALGLREEIEALVSLVFNTFVGVGGQIARHDIASDKVLSYLLARQSGDFSRLTGVVEKPNETLVVLLRLAELLALAETLGPLLWRLDGVATATFVTPDYAQFGQDMMRGGSNLEWGVGFDVFRAEDLAASWPRPTPRPASPLQAAAAMFASLLYPDRCAWFCLEEPATTVESPFVAR